MFSVTEAEAATIRAAFDQDGELSAAVELRRIYPGITSNETARMCARSIAGWPLTAPVLPPARRRSSGQAAIANPTGKPPMARARRPG